MDKHDELCEKADVGSLCDCSCAGSKHAIMHTRGGVPGAGGITRRAQKAAAAAGKAPVINNRAVPKEGSRVAPGAPKSFTDAAAGPAKSAAKTDAPKSPGDKLHAAALDIELWSRQTLAKVKADNPGISQAAAVKKGRAHPEFAQRLADFQDTVADAKRSLGSAEVTRILNDAQHQAAVKHGGAARTPAKPATPPPAAKPAKAAAKAKWTPPALPEVTPAGADHPAATFAGKKVKPVTAGQAPVLEAVGRGSKYRGQFGSGQGQILPQNRVNELERAGLIRTIFANGDTHLTEAGHQKLAAQRGDRKYQDLNEKVAAAEAAHAKAGQDRAAHTERRNEPLYRDFARNSQAVQSAEREAYGRMMLAKKERDDHARAAGGEQTGGQQAGGGKPPITLMSDLSKYSDAELQARHDEIQAKIGPQGGISGPQADIQQRIERELARRKPAGGQATVASRRRNGETVTEKTAPPVSGPAARPKTGDGKGPVRDTFDYGDTYSRGSSTDQGVTAKTMRTFDGTGAELVGEHNTSVGDRVTHLSKGVGTVEKVGRPGDPLTVKFDGSGKSEPVMGHLMVHGEHGDKVGAADKPAAAGGRDPSESVRTRAGDGRVVEHARGYTPEQAAQRDEARNARLGNSQGRRARVQELAGLSREQFDALPADEQQRALADLKRIAESGDTRSYRGRYGIKSTADQNHIGKAKELTRRFTAEKTAPVDKPPVVSRFADLGSSREVEGFLKGLDRGELVELAEEHGWLTKAEADKLKLFGVRAEILNKARDVISRRRGER